MVSESVAANDPVDTVSCPFKSSAFIACAFFALTKDILDAFSFGLVNETPIVFAPFINGDESFPIFGNDGAWNNGWFSNATTDSAVP